MDRVDPNFLDRSRLYQYDNPEHDEDFGEYSAYDFDKEETNYESVSNSRYFHDEAEGVYDSVALTPPKKEKRKSSIACEKDWNKDFLAIQKMPESIGKYQALSKLAQDFTYAAKLYSKLIISELELDNELKTLKPVFLGYAGGAKYRCHGILFKFALDFHGLYGGDEYAMKAAGHELNGLMYYYNCEIPQLNVPLMCLIDYRGFRLVAMSLLPVTNETLIYGSSNAGVTVKNIDPTFNRLMKQASKRLNLAAHFVGPPGELVKLHAPVDIEGHKSEDGNYYLLDFARTMPPQKLVKRSTNDRVSRHLFELLRPELVLASPVPLSPDAFTKFVKNDPKADSLNANVGAAFRNLLTDVIPALAHKLATMAPKALDQIVLTEELHKCGVNLRHMGLLRCCISRNECGPPNFQTPSAESPSSLSNSDKSQQNDSTDESYLTNSSESCGPGRALTLQMSAVKPGSEGAMKDPTIPSLIAIKHLKFNEGPSRGSPQHSPRPSPRNSGSFTIFKRNIHTGRPQKPKFIDSAQLVKVLLLEEMVARVMKTEVQARLRACMKRVGIPAEGPYLNEVINYLNSVFYFERKTFWTSQVKTLLLDKFIVSVAQEEMDPSFDLSTYIQLHRVIPRFMFLTGFRLHRIAVTMLSFGSCYIIESDIKHMEGRVKSMNIVSQAEAIMLAMQADTHKGNEATRLFKLANDKFTISTKSGAHSALMYYKWGEMMIRMTSHKTFGDIHVSTILKLAIKYLQRALTLRPDLYDASFSLGCAYIDLVINTKLLWSAIRSSTVNPVQYQTWLIDAGNAFRHAIQGNPETYTTLFDKFITKDPKTMDAKLLASVSASVYSPNLYETCVSKECLTIDCFTPFKMDSLLKLASITSSLTTLKIDYVGHIDPTVGAALGDYLPKLTSLTMSELTGIDMIPSTFDKLKAILLHECPINDNTIRDMAQRFPFLTSLSLSGCPFITDSVVQYINQFKHLQQLSLGQFSNFVGNTSYCYQIKNPLLEVPQLTSLSLSGMVVLNDVTLIHIAKHSPRLVKICKTVEGSVTLGWQWWPPSVKNWR